MLDMVQYGSIIVQNPITIVHALRLVQVDPPQSSPTEANLEPATPGPRPLPRPPSHQRTAVYTTRPQHAGHLSAAVVK